LTRAGRVRAAWRRLSGPGGRYPAAGRLGGQEAVAPYIHAGPVGGVPTRLLIASSEGQSWYTGGDTHAAELDLFARRMVGPGDVVFDLGANQGVTAIGLARLVGRRGRVYAFDPFPMNCDLIRFNCRLNGIRNVEVVEVGLGDRAGTLAVSAHQQCLAADSPLDPTPVRVETLDAFAHLRPRFVKMDIEGAEVSALAAAGRLLAQRPNLYVELHRGLIPRFGRQVEELADLLPADGYATAGLWTAPDALTPITRASLRDLPHNCGHVLMTRD
jgi:FkbM family methyltransferase